MPRTISNRVGLGLHGSQSEKMGSVARAPVFVPVRERHVASARIHHERVLLVRRGGQTRVAWFIQWSAGEEGHGQLHLLKPVRALVPPTALGVGLEHGERGLASHQVVDWLEREGFEVLGDIAADCDEPLGRR